MATTTEATEAPALAVLRRMLDERWPRRSRVADRILGRDGDHARGNAIDISYDPVNGPDLERLAAALLRDPRTAVVLWRGRIAEPDVAGGAWRPYAGLAEGSHAGHLHLSIDPRRRASQAAWPLEIADGETGDVFWPFDSEQAKEARRAQREYLRGTWVRDTALGKFLRLDEPDGPAPAPPPPAKPSPGFEYYGHRHVDADTGASKLEQAGKEAATGASIGGAVGTVLEAVPVVGPILHGAATVIGAIGGFFAGLGRDSFHPDALAAAAWLALFSLNPAMMYSGIDGIDVDEGEERAARLVRYFLLVSHTVPPAGELYNPKSDRKDNAYMQKVDPRFPQTNPRHNRRIKWAVMAHMPTAPEVTTPVAAQSLLSLIRKVLAKSGVMQWDQAKEHLRELRRNLRHVRALAGETGRDVNLEVLFRGNVSPKLASYPPLPKHRVVAHKKRHRRETGDTGAPAAAPTQGGWTLVDPTWLPLAARVGLPITNDVIERYPALKTVPPEELKRARLVIVPFARGDYGQGYSTARSYTTFGWFVNPAEPWRGAEYYVPGEGDEGVELPRITPVGKNHGKIVGVPWNSADWSQGVLIGGSILDRDGNSRVPPGWQTNASETGDSGVATGPVIIYGASWCGPCHRAADYLRERSVAFVMKDIEQTIGARAEMEAKLARAGLQPRAIPVIDVSERILVGFNPAALDDALRVAGFAATPSAAPRARFHEVTRSQAYTAKVMGTYTIAESIARDWGVLDRNWFSELMRANPDKARDSFGYWATLVEGEILRIPPEWPEPPAGPRKKIVIPPETNAPAKTNASAAADTGRIDDWDSYPTPGFRADE